MATIYVHVLLLLLLLLSLLLAVVVVVLVWDVYRVPCARISRNFQIPGKVKVKVSVDLYSASTVFYNYQLL